MDLNLQRIPANIIIIFQMLTSPQNRSTDWAPSDNYTDVIIKTRIKAWAKIQNMSGTWCARLLICSACWHMSLCNSCYAEMRIWLQGGVWAIMSRSYLLRDQGRQTNNNQTWTDTQKTNTSKQYSSLHQHICNISTVLHNYRHVDLYATSPTSQNNYDRLL